MSPAQSIEVEDGHLPQRGNAPNSLNCGGEWTQSNDSSGEVLRELLRQVLYMSTVGSTEDAQAYLPPAPLVTRLASCLGGGREVADGPRGRGVGMLLRGGLRAIHELLLLLLTKHY